MSTSFKIPGILLLSFQLAAPPSQQPPQLIDAAQAEENKKGLIDFLSDRYIRNIWNYALEIRTKARDLEKEIADAMALQPVSQKNVSEKISNYTSSATYSLGDMAAAISDFLERHKAANPGKPVAREEMRDLFGEDPLATYHEFAISEIRLLGRVTRFNANELTLQQQSLIEKQKALSDFQSKMSANPPPEEPSEQIKQRGEESALKTEVEFQGYGVETTKTQIRFAVRDIDWVLRREKIFYSIDGTPDSDEQRTKMLEEAGLSIPEYNNWKNISALEDIQVPKPISTPQPEKFTPPRP